MIRVVPPFKKIVRHYPNGGTDLQWNPSKVETGPGQIMPRQVQASAPALTLPRRHERCAKCGAPVGGGVGTIAAAIPLPPTTLRSPTHAAGTEARLGPAQELRPAKGFRSLAIALLTCVHDPFGLRVAQWGMGR